MSFRFTNFKVLKTFRNFIVGPYGFCCIFMLFRQFPTFIVATIAFLAFIHVIIGAGVLERAILIINKYDSDLPDDTALYRPWMEHWEITHHNGHTDATLKNKSYGQRPFHYIPQCMNHCSCMKTHMWHVKLFR